MNFSDLETEELLVYFALAKIVIRADGVLSEDEAVAMEKRVVADIGATAFVAGLKTLKDRFHSATEVRDAAVALERADAKKFIFDELLVLAESDDLSPKEEAMLAGIAETLGVER